MNKLLYFIYCILFFLGVNFFIFFFLFGYLLLYDYSHPFISGIIDRIGFILISIITTYLSAILTFWGYYGIRKLKRKLFLKPFKEAFLLMTRALPLFFIMNSFVGFIYYYIYDPSSFYLGVLALFTALFYVSLISLGYLSATSLYQAEMLETEFDDILKKNQYNIIGTIVVFAGLLLVIFVPLYILLGFLYAIYTHFNILLISYGLFFILFYPVFTIGIIVIMFKRSKRVAIDFLFTD